MKDVLVNNIELVRCDGFQLGLGNFIHISQDESHYRADLLHLIRGLLYQFFAHWHAASITSDVTSSPPSKLMVKLEITIINPY